MFEVELNQLEAEVEYFCTGASSAEERMILALELHGKLESLDKQIDASIHGPKQRVQSMASRVVKRLFLEPNTK